MRDPFKIVVALTVVILGGLVVVLLTRPSVVTGVAPVLSSIIHNRPLLGRTDPAEDPKPTSLPPKRGKTRLELQQPNAGLAGPLEFSGPVITVRVAQAFPIDWQIRKGTPESSVLGIYGRPSFWVTVPSSGQLFQQFIYIDASTGRKTSVSFVNSLVTGAQTSPN